MTLLILYASLLLLTSINHGSSTDSNHNNDMHINNDMLISSSCDTTLYPDICYSTLNSHTTTKNLSITSKKHVIQLTLNKTKQTLESTLLTITNILNTTSLNLTKRTENALHDCLEMETVTLEQLNTAIRYLDDYPTRKPLRRYADDLKTLISTAITNKDTCVDGLSSDHIVINNHLRKSIIQEQEYGGKMCSNVLAMIKNMTDTDMANNPEVDYNYNYIRRKLKAKDKDRIVWPEWVSVRDRKLFGFFGATPDVTVAKEKGKANYTTVGEAVDAAPSKGSKRYVIKIMKGTYEEYIHIPKSKTNLMFVGEGRGSTIITGNKSVGAGDGTTTTKSATVAVMGDRFLARDITFRNTAGPIGEQAVALRVAADLTAFYMCGIEGYQDTLYVHSNRQFYIKCFITGTIDFIFGNAAVVFQFCDIMSRKPGPNQMNMITAQGRMDVNQDTGIVIQRCNIGALEDLKPVQANISTYLGRPWKQFSRTVVMGSNIGDLIKKEGWSPWEGDFGLNTCYYREYRNTGPGSDTSKRVKWKGWGVLKDNNEARPFTVPRFINGWSWLLSTGFPFWPGI